MQFVSNYKATTAVKKGKITEINTITYKTFELLPVN